MLWRRESSNINNADSEYAYAYDEKARKERESMKAKQDWQFIGRFVGTMVQLFTLISGVFKKAEVGLDAIEWLVGSGKTFFTIKLTEITEEYKQQNQPPAKKEVMIDSIIRVDRSIPPSYPQWMYEVMHPELERVGPAEYNILAVEQWYHDGQKGGKYIEGNEIYNHLKMTDALKICLGLRDLEEIQKKDIVFFRKHFKGKAVFGWASIVRSHTNSLLVPYLYEDDDEVVLDWFLISNVLNKVHSTLRHASRT